MRNDEAFANAKYIPGGEEYYAIWQSKATRLRMAPSTRCELNVPYGSGPSHWYDLFAPDGEAQGLMIFVHGGYWMETGPRDYTHLAQGALARGWSVAMPSYSLAPAVRIGAMVAEIVAAVEVLAQRHSSLPIAITGHSAGGHLAARLACQGMLSADLRAQIRCILPISPLSYLPPLLQTSMNETLRMDRDEAWAESPALLPREPSLKVHVWVGGNERPAFLDQARRLGNAWACPVTVEAGRHHFDVIEGLERADSPLMNHLLA